MNYFKASGVTTSGKKISLLEVECAQQRRLPHLQILGSGAGSAVGQRERVLAALDSSGFRLPARRITVNLHGAADRSTEETDFPVALAILGSMKAFPQERMRKFIASGALSLDGRLLPLAHRAPLRAWLRENPSSSLLLPWEDSHILGTHAEGGGFSTLKDAVEFLRGDGASALRSSEQSAVSSEAACPRWVVGRPLAQRILAVAAAGAHPLLVVGGGFGGIRPLAEELLRFLPPLGPEQREEMQSLQREVGEGGNGRPLRELDGELAMRSLRSNGRNGRAGEISLAHGGLLLLSNLGERPANLLQTLQEPIKSGVLRQLNAGKACALPADWQLVSATELCACGNGPGCRCLPKEVDRWRRKLEMVQPYFPLVYPYESVPGKETPPKEWGECIHRARERAISRQGRANHRLDAEEVFSVKSWSKDALAAWRTSFPRREWLPLAKVALTVSDLNQCREVGLVHVREAEHYASEPFSSSFSGKRR